MWAKPHTGPRREGSSPPGLVFSRQQPPWLDRSIVTALEVSAASASLLSPQVPAGLGAATARSPGPGAWTQGRPGRVPGGLSPGRGSSWPVEFALQPLLVASPFPRGIKGVFICSKPDISSLDISSKLIYSALQRSCPHCPLGSVWRRGRSKGTGTMLLYLAALCALHGAAEVRPHINPARHVFVLY